MKDVAERTKTSCFMNNAINSQNNQVTKSNNDMVIAYQQNADKNYIIQSPPNKPSRTAASQQPVGMAAMKENVYFGSGKPEKHPDNRQPLSSNLTYFSSGPNQRIPKSANLVHDAHTGASYLKGLLLGKVSYL